MAEDPTEDAVVLADTCVPSTTAPIIMSDNELNTKILSLNQKQREYFEVVYNWARRFVKHLSSLTNTKINPLHIFLTGEQEQVNLI